MGVSSGRACEGRNGGDSHIDPCEINECPGQEMWNFDRMLPS